ncbi:DMT family transporter [Robertkochia marina]|uniref:DMT family transporter n=1 Tax=Robertkochia marina TaxID=1227945 RepID=A0A4S3M0V1_9FLAO|nr:DMT family transporter [Robertkochia marina]THD68060.1 DMT family transporter [Robertkochia marina]TRZ42655.1 DMT family transporter [Robertkochia marina]
MIYLFLSVLVSSSLFVIFKLFNKYQVNTFNAIVINYLVASITGLLLYPSPWNIAQVTGSAWFPGTVFLGFMFIFIFMVMARTAQEIGLSVASVAGKMSLVIPVIFGIAVYGESMNIIKSAGIILALAAVYLVSLKADEPNRLNRNKWFLPAILFAGSGIIDTTLKYLESKYVAQEAFPLYSSSIFAIAALAGSTVLIYRLSTGKLSFRPKDILGGIFLGIPNYFSIYFILKALKQDAMESSVVFSVNNVAIVLLTTIFGIVLFREKLQPKNWIGVVLAMISILLITFSKL